jgi:hypothetical protein
MKNNLLLVLFVMFLGVFTLLGQDETQKPPEEGLHNEVGLVTGLSTGFGLSYKYTFRKYGMQLVFIPLIFEDYSIVSAGFTFMYNIYKDQGSGVYLYQANHLFTFENSVSIINGIGVGVELKFSNRVAINLMGGYANYDGEVFASSAEVGLFYKF